MSNKNESKIISFVKGFDSNGGQVSFRLKGDTSNKSIIGAFLSILSLFASIALSFPTFLKFIHFKEPNIVVGTEFSTMSKNDTNTPIDFSDSSLYVSMSFYSPLINSSYIQFDDNNYTFVQYINNLPIICSTCKNDDTESYMNLCNDKEFDDIQLKSMSLSKSNRILNIFRNFSFCFPNYLNGSIKDIDTDNNDSNNNNTRKNSTSKSQDSNNKTFSHPFDSSLTIVIPINTKPLNESGVETNSISRSDSVNLDIISNPISYNTNSDNQQQINPEQSQINDTSHQESQLNPNNSVISEQNPNIIEQTNNTNESVHNSNNTQNSQDAINFNNSSSSLHESQLSPTFTSTHSPNASSIDSSTDSQTVLEADLSSNSSAVLHTDSLNNSPSLNTDTAHNSTINARQISSKIQTNEVEYSKSTSNSKLRILNDLDKPLQTTKLQKEIRLLESQQPEQHFQSLQIDSLMMEKMNRFRFPKILLINRSFQINPNARMKKGEPLYENIFNLDILDYRDLLTGNPKSYNIFIQQSTIEITKPHYFFSSTTETKKILKVYSIEEDSISVDLNQGAIISFKAVSEIPKISITFVLFTDWLSAFGSFSTVFGLINAILAGFYNDILLKSNIINSLFNNLS